MIDSMPVPISRREFPRLTLRQEDLAGLGIWEVNSQHYLVIKVELVAKRNTKALGIDGLKDRQKIEGTFQVLNVKPLGNKPIDAKTLEKEDMERVVADVRSGKM